MVSISNKIGLISFSIFKLKLLFKTENKKYNVMIIDVDSKDLSEGLMFPPRPFMTNEFLNNVYAALDDDGILVVNLASRSQNVFDECNRLPILCEFRAQPLSLFPRVFKQ
mgnify:CR=1 FL=1